LIEVASDSGGDVRVIAIKMSGKSFPLSEFGELAVDE